jgi:hypothetical protein
LFLAVDILQSFTRTTHKLEVIIYFNYLLSRPGRSISYPIAPSLIPQNHPNNYGPLLVDRSLSKVLDDVGTVKETTVAGSGTAKGASTLNDVVVALKVGLFNTAQRRTAVVSTRHASTGLAVGGCASILLQAGVGDTACSVGNRSVVVLATNVDSAARSVADTFNVHGASRGNGSEAENKGGERELHFELLKLKEEVCFDLIVVKKIWDVKVDQPTSGREKN